MMRKWRGMLSWGGGGAEDDTGALPCPARSAGAPRPLQVAGEEIDLEVDAGAGTALAPGGERERVRDDHRREAAILDRIDRQRRAVGADRAVLDDVAGEPCRRLED